MTESFAYSTLNYPFRADKIGTVGNAGPGIELKIAEDEEILVRGKGLLLGAALNEEWKGRARDVLVAAGKEGLLVLIAGANVVRFTPSLVITQEEIEEGLAKLDKAIATLV